MSQYAIYEYPVAIAEAQLDPSVQEMGAFFLTRYGDKYSYTACNEDRARDVSRNGHYAWIKDRHSDGKWRQI